MAEEDTTIADVRGMELNELYKVLRSMREDIGNYESLLVKARFGINIRFDIHDWIRGIGIRPKEKTGIVIINGKPYQRSDIYTEIEAREDIMKEAIIEAMEQEEIVGPRRPE